jgi:YaiO family outer membrane protein
MKLTSSIFILFLAAFFSIGAHGQIKNPAASPVAPKPDETDAARRGEAQFNYSFESLSNGYGEWRTASLDISRKFSGGRTIYGSFLTTERFRRRDRQLTAGIYQPLGNKWAAQFEASVSPTHRTLAKWTAHAQIERRLEKGWNLSAGYRRTNYTAAKVNLVNAGAEKYFGNYRAAYTLYVSNLEKNGTSASHRFQVNRYYGEQASSVGIAAGFGRELESLGNRGVLQTDVQSVSINGRHWLNRRWGFNYDASWTRQGKFYVRRGLNFGIRYKF